MKNIKVEKVIIEAYPGSELSNCVKETIIYSLQNDVVCELHFNTKILEIDNSDYLEKLYKKYDKLPYNK